MSIELTDVASQDIWAPDDGEVLRSHPSTVGVQRHLVQVPHQEVNRPENMVGVGLKMLLVSSSPVMGGRQAVENLSELLSPLPLGQLARQHQVRVEVVGDEGGGQRPEVELEHRGDAVDVVEQGSVPGQVWHPLVVEQVSEDGT